MHIPDINSTVSYRTPYTTVPRSFWSSDNRQVVLNNFGDKDAPSQVRLMKVTLQNMFPSINVATVKLQDCRRVVMFNLDKIKGTVEMRHFAVRATPTGIAKAIKKVHRQGTDVYERLRILIFLLAVLHMTCIAPRSLLVNSKPHPASQAVPGINICFGPLYCRQGIGHADMYSTDATQTRSFHLLACT